MVLGVFLTKPTERGRYLRELIRSPCRWASLLTLGWTLSIWNNTQSAVNWPPLEDVFEALGRPGTTVVFGVCALLPLLALLIPILWVRIVCTTLPLAWWLFIFLQGLRSVGLYTPAMWTALVCILSLIHQEVRRAWKWETSGSGG